MMIDDVRVTIQNARVPCVRCRVSYYIPRRGASGKLSYRCIGCGSCMSAPAHHHRKAAIMRALDGDAPGNVDLFVRMPDESVVAVSIHFEGTASEHEPITQIALDDPYAGVTITEAEIRALVLRSAATPEIGEALLAELYADLDG